MAGATEIATAASSYDPTTLVANLTILIGFLAAVFTGIKRGWRQAKDTVVNEGPNRLLAATIMETVTLTQWTESNKHVRDSILELIAVIRLDHDSRLRLITEMTDVQISMNELRHAIQISDMTRRQGK